MPTGGGSALPTRHTVLTILAGILLFALDQSARADVTAQDIAAGLRTNLVHPYLYFTAEEKAALLERTKTDSRCGDYLKQLLAESNRLLYTPVEIQAPPRTKDPRYDPSDEFENYLTDNTERAWTLALAYQMTGEKKYAEKAFAFADVVCDQPTWVHGAHEFPVIYDRVWPWGAKDDQVVFSYAQWTDHMVFQLAAVYDWLYPALEKRQRDRIRGALLEKAILRVRGNYDYHWWAAAYRCNWCAVLNASLGTASIALLTEDPQLVDVVAESWNRVGKTLDQVGDGGWQEGLSYMGYMLDESLRFGDVMKRVTGGKFDLYTHPRIPDAVNTLLYCRVPPGLGIHFGDSGGGSAGGYSLFNSIASTTGNPVAAWLLKNTGGIPGSLLEYIQPSSNTAPALPKETSRHFRSVDWMIMRSDFTDPEKLVIFTKCGLNNDPHHGHLDQGHFSLYWRGQEFLCDHGSAGYDRAYFDKERWSYPLASTGGHNTVMVNGEQQMAGKLKDQPWNETIGGKVVEFRPGETRDYTLLDPTGAYPGQELKKWRRHIILEKPDIAVILDEVTCAKDAEIEARFHSSATQTIRDRYVTLKGDKGEMALIPVSESGFSLREGKHAIMMAQRNASFRWVPYFGAVTRGTGGRTVLAAVIVPAGNDGEAQKIAESVKLKSDDSGNYSLSFAKGGKKFAYRFVNGGDGLTLEKTP